MPPQGTYSSLIVTESSSPLDLMSKQPLHNQSGLMGHLVVRLAPEIRRRWNTPILILPPHWAAATLVLTFSVQIKKKSQQKAKQEERMSKEFTKMEEAAMKAYQEDLKRMEREAAGRILNYLQAAG